MSKNFSVISPEDIVLLKLQWFHDSSSERQWRDVLGILAVQAEQLDFEYLNKWADILRINQLLAKAISEAES